MLIPRSDAPSLLREGETCWKVTTATRASLLVDAENYFAALRTSLLKARRQILIAGWDFDTRTQLPRPQASADAEQLSAPTELGELLGYLIRTRPGLEIHVLRWDYHLIYMHDRELATRRKLEKLGIHFHSDAAHPIAGCVHHKVVVIDDVLAFCGGIDLTHNRLDSSRHEPDDQRRKAPDGTPYGAVHDTQLCVSGPVARSLAEYLRECWHVSCGRCPTTIKDTHVLWPDRLPVDFRNVRVGISRTLPPRGLKTAVREVENFYLAAIGAAQRTVFVENQYFTSERIARALADACEREPLLEGLLIGCEKPKAFIEYHTMGYGRARFNDILANSAARERMPMLAALDASGAGINVHSKLAIFDDRWLTVGSANLNRRSMGFDVECNVIIEVNTQAERRHLRKLRDQLVAEHLDMQTDEVPFAIRAHGLSRLPFVYQRGRKLVPIDPRERERNLGPVLVPFFDREKPWPEILPSPVTNDGLGWQHAVALVVIATTAAILGHTFFGDEPMTMASLQKLMVLFDAG